MARPNYFLALVSLTATIGLPTALTAIALSACADNRPSPAASAVPHGSSAVDSAKASYSTSSHNGQVLLPGNPSYGDLGMPVSFSCPEQDPAQPNCKVQGSGTVW